MKLTIKNISYEIKGKTLIKNVSAEFVPGYLYGIVGPNGSGKTTFLKTVAGLLSPTHGNVLWNGSNLMDLSRQEISKIISLVLQAPTAFFDFTVLEMVSMGCYSHACSRKQEFLRSEKVLREVNAWHLKDSLLSQISGGERQRVYIARALATESSVLLLDEPFSHLDLRHQVEVWNILKELVRAGKIVIVSVHDLRSAQHYCDRVMIFNNGECVDLGDYGLVMTPEILQDVFGIKNLGLL